MDCAAIVESRGCTGDVRGHVSLLVGAMRDEVADAVSAV